MKGFLSQLGLGMVKLLVGFVLLAVAARFFGPINWFFFQQNEHNRVFLTMLEMEKALTKGDHFDVLVFGSSSCEYAIDPLLLADSTGLSVYKFVTGGQSIEMSMKVAPYLIERIKPKYVFIDMFPLYGPSFTEEGVERAILNAPNATSGLTMTILSAYPYSATTDYLWAARAIGTAVKPFAESSLQGRPEFNMIAPGFTSSVGAPPSKPDKFMHVPFFALAVNQLNNLAAQLSLNGQQLVGIVPTAQNIVIEVEGKPEFPMLVPHPRPDTCFWDATHMRKPCVAGYSMELVHLFNNYRKGIAHDQIRLPR